MTLYLVTLQREEKPTVKKGYQAARNTQHLDQLAQEVFRGKCRVIQSIPIKKKEEEAIRGKYPTMIDAYKETKAPRPA